MGEPKHPFLIAYFSLKKIPTTFAVSLILGSQSEDAARPYYALTRLRPVTSGESASSSRLESSFEASGGFRFHSRLSRLRLT